MLLSPGSQQRVQMQPVSNGSGDHGYKRPRVRSKGMCFYYFIIIHPIKTQLSDEAALHGGGTSVQHPPMPVLSDDELSSESGSDGEPDMPGGSLILM